MSSMENNIDLYILNNIIDICSKISGVKKSNISLMSSINNDLKIDGDDIVELLEHLVIKYNLNTEEFEYSKYFDWEGQINIISQTSIRRITSLIFNFPANVYCFPAKHTVR